MVCPSFPGEEEVPCFGGIPNAPAGVKIGTGNYMALASTHYQSGNQDLESGLPATHWCRRRARIAQAARIAATAVCRSPAWFRQAVQKAGLGFQSLSDGTSKCTWSRKAAKRSSPPGTAALPRTSSVRGQSIADQPVGVMQGTAAGSPVYWNCRDGSTCDSALNKGDTKGDRAKYYQGSAKGNPHPAVMATAFGVRAAGTRVWSCTASPMPTRKAVGNASIRTCTCT